MSRPGFEPGPPALSKQRTSVYPLYDRYHSCILGQRINLCSGCYSVYWDYFCRLILLSAFTTQVRKKLRFESRVRILRKTFLSFLEGIKQHTFNTTVFIHNGLLSQLKKGIAKKFHNAERTSRLEPTFSTLTSYYLTSVPRLLGTQ